MEKMPHKINAGDSMFGIFFERDSCSWISWEKTQSTFEIPKEAPYSEMIVPTLDSIRIKGVFNRLLQAGRHILLVGPTGTGKSVMINQELRTTYTNEDWTYISMAFSAQTTAGQT
jgi:dynein heavy chain, axonemal